MRRLLSAIILCAAVGASAAIVAGKTWSFYDDEKQLTKVLLKVNSKEGISLLTTNTNRFESVSLTREEAASLGRALLEAAGQPEKVCPPPNLCPSGCLNLCPNGNCFTSPWLIPAGAP